jgi:predicted AAA+ superfamily ATPase
LDFYEFEKDISKEERFQTYLKFGGMPSIVEFDFNLQRANDILEGIYSTVILKDVMDRNKISDHSLLQKIVMFLADNIGSTTSPNSIGNYLSNEGVIRREKKFPASRTVENYITMLQNSFIFYSAKRFDIKGKQYLKTLEKNYIVDTGIRNMLLGYRDIDRGHILENIVFFELLRRGYRVSIGKIGEKEIDFIAENPDDKLYIQVAETILSEETKERELVPLREIKDNYEKWILSMDKNFVKSFDGIKVKNIIEFLLE